jgi:hypothetical protein
MQRKYNRKQVSQSKSIPAPTKGLNARDAVADMDPTYALSLDNYFCTPTTVDVRNGQTNWATGLAAWVETVLHYTSATGTKQFGIAGGKIFDTTSGGAVGSALVSGLTNSRFQWVNFDTPGNWYAVAVNGADGAQIYNGSAWQTVTQISTPLAITGIDPSNFIHVNAFQNRLYFTAKNSLSVWYLGVNSIQGAATEFPLASIFTKGGYLMGMLTWTVDNTAGVQDFAVFVTSEGEVAVYQGYDPDFAATFTLVGKFVMGRPIGRRFFEKMGSDNVLVCADGIALLSKELTTDRQLSATLSYNILNLINNDVASYAANFGWQAVYYPIGNKLVINVPAMENSSQYQYIMNTITGAWATWGKLSSPLNAACWDVWEDEIYYGGNGVIVKGDDNTNLSDNGVAILTDMKPAFSYFDDLGSEKEFKMARPIFLSTDPITPSYVLNVDYEDVPAPPPSVATGTGTPWDTSPWDTSAWGSSGFQVNKEWLTVGGLGYAASFRMATLTNGVGVSLQSIDYVYEKGGIL